MKLPGPQGGDADAAARPLVEPVQQVLQERLAQSERVDGGGDLLAVDPAPPEVRHQLQGRGAQPVDDVVQVEQRPGSDAHDRRGQLLVVPADDLEPAHGRGRQAGREVAQALSPLEHVGLGLHRQLEVQLVPVHVGVEQVVRGQLPDEAEVGTGLGQAGVEPGRRVDDGDEQVLRGDLGHDERVGHELELPGHRLVVAHPVGLVVAGDGYGRGAVLGEHRLYRRDLAEHHRRQVGAVAQVELDVLARAEQR